MTNGGCIEFVRVLYLISVSAQKVVKIMPTSSFSVRDIVTLHSVNFLIFEVNVYLIDHN